MTPSLDETRALVLGLLEKRPMMIPEIVDELCTGPQSETVRQICRNLVWSDAVCVQGTDLRLHLKSREARLEQLLKVAVARLENANNVRNGSLIARIRSELA